jgi:hypothetical protein
VMQKVGKGATSGAWHIEERLIVDNDGVTPAHMISDGEHELLTMEDPLKLMAAIAELLEVKSIQFVPDIPDGERPATNPT